MKHMWIVLVVSVLVGALPSPQARGEDPPTPVKVEVLERGTAPRLRLRYAPKPGTAQRVRATLRMEQSVRHGAESQPVRTIPAHRIHMDVICDDRKSSGDSLIRYVLHDVEVLEQEDVPPQLEDMLKQVMTGAVIRMVADSQGRCEASAVEPPDYFPPKLEAGLSKIWESMDYGSHPFPKARVGIRARWSATESDESDGWTIDTTTTYQLRHLDKEWYSLGAELEVSADEQTRPRELLPEGQSVTLIACTGSGTGRMLRRFGEPAPRTLNVDFTMTTTVRTAIGDAVEDAETTIDVTLTMEADPPRPAPKPKPWVAPTETEAVALVQRMLDHAAKGEFAEITPHLHRDRILAGLFGAHLAALSDAEREELEGMFQQAFAARSFSFPEIHQKLKEGTAKLGELVATAPRRNLRKVSCSLDLGSGDALELAWVIEQTPDGPRIIEEFDRTGVAAVVRDRSAFERTRKEGGGSPLSWLRGRLGLESRPGSADTMPPTDGRPAWASLDARSLTLRAPSLSKAAKDAGSKALDSSPWRDRIALFVTSVGDVFYRPDGRASHLARITLANGSPEEQQQSLDTVKTWLQKAGGGAEGTGPDRVLIRADRDARWQYVCWLARLCRDPAVGIRDVGLSVDLEDGGYGVLPIAPPPDTVTPAEAKSPAATLKIITKGFGPDAPALVMLPGKRKISLPGPTAEGDADEAMEAREKAIASIRAALEPVGAKHWQVQAPFPRGIRVRHGDLVRILHLLDELGAEEIDVKLLALP